MSFDKLDPTQFNLTASQARQYWHCVVDADTLIEDVLKPVFWVHVMSRLKVGALVDLVSPDFTLDVTVRVTMIREGLVFVRPIRVYEDKKAREAVYARRAALASEGVAVDVMEQQRELSNKSPDGYKVGVNPTNKLWYVTIKATGLQLYKDIPDRAEALKRAWAHANAAGVTSEKAPQEA